MAIVKVVFNQVFGNSGQVTFFHKVYRGLPIALEAGCTERVLKVSWHFLERENLCEERNICKCIYSQYTHTLTRYIPLLLVNKITELMGEKLTEPEGGG